MIHYLSEKKNVSEGWMPHLMLQLNAGQPNEGQNEHRRWSAFIKTQNCHLDPLDPKDPRLVLSGRIGVESHICCTVDHSQNRIHSGLTDHLGLRKLSVRWVSRLLTADQNLTRILQLFGIDPDNSIRRVLMDET